MRSLTRIALTGPAGSKGAWLATLALLVTAFAAPPALGQSGGVSAPGSGGAPAPDPAPTPASPRPDSAPGSGSEPTTSPATPPASVTPPDTTSGVPEAITPAEAATSRAPAPPSSRSRQRTSDKRAGKDKARDERNARRHHQRSPAGRASPTSVFGVNLPLVGAVGSSTDTAAKSPPVELIAWALLALVLAGAALLMLTARLWRMEGLTAPMPAGAQWLQRILQTARFTPRGTGRPVS
jgi:hypothetical protein